jgi:hypothetical protein
MVIALKRTYDLIGKVAEGPLTVDKAYEYLELVMDSKQRRRAPAFLGFKALEWRAFLHGAGIGQLARWRVTGWPTECFICRQELRISASYWFVCELPSGDQSVAHIKCLSNRPQ